MTPDRNFRPIENSCLQVFRVHVLVNFLSQVIFAFLLFLGLVIYANEVETKEKKKLPEITEN